MALNGDPDRRPVRITVPQTWHHAAAESAVGAMVAHQRRLATGEAQFVDVSVQAAVFWTGLNAMIAHAIQGKNIERNGTRAAAQHAHHAARLPVRRRRGRAGRHPGDAGRLIPWMVEAGVVSRRGPAPRTGAPTRRAC